MLQEVLSTAFGAMFLSILCAQPSEPPFYTDKMNLRVYIDANGKTHPITTAADWQKRREHILANMQLVMGPLPDEAKKVALDIDVIEEVKLDKVTRKKITFVAEKDDRPNFFFSEKKKFHQKEKKRNTFIVPAYLLIPNDLKGKAPAMLCLHQTTSIGKGEPAGLGGNNNLHYALELAERGYITLAPDYPNFGDYQFNPYEHGYTSATMKGIWNHIRAVDLLQSLPQVDSDNIGCIGHSLGGHNSIFVAVFEPRIKVIVSSCGFNSFFKYYNGDLTGWSHNGYMPRIASVYKKDPKKMPFDFTELVAALAGRPFFINAPLKDSNFEVSGVKDCLKAAAPVYELFGAKDYLIAVYPDVGHDFPPDVREAAYTFVDKWLKN
ncbi:acetylxylan esterase [Candidatus Poribacteria bacterium]|nr:acetylxylan esterase [Candidatus Poribacteria bacterium]